MSPGGGRHPYSCSEPRREAPGNEIENAGAERRENDQALPDPPYELEEGQCEDVEASITPQNRVGLPEGCGIPPGEPCFPLRRGVQRYQGCEHHRQRRCERRQLPAAG